MADKINSVKTGLALSIVFGIVSAVCGILLLVLPITTLNVFGAIFHGLDLNKISVTPTILSIIYGIIEAVILGFLFGWLFGIVYNMINGK